EGSRWPAVAAPGEGPFPPRGVEHDLEDVGGDVAGKSREFVEAPMASGPAGNVLQGWVAHLEEADPFEGGLDLGGAARQFKDGFELQVPAVAACSSPGGRSEDGFLTEGEPGQRSRRFHGVVRGRCEVGET